MKKLECTTWRHLLSSTRATEIVETAIILPLFFMIFMAVFWFGQAFRIYGTLAHAARAGAEAAVAPLCTTCSGVGASTAARNAQTAVYKALLAAHLDKNQLVATKSWTSPMLCTCPVTSSSSCTSASAASCDGSVTDVCVQVNVQLSYPTTSAMGTCGTSVSARYRYASHFRIPLTTMDLGNVLLPGQAQMRAETQ